MTIMNYINTLNFNAVCYKLAQYEIGDRLHADDSTLQSDIILAGGKQQYLNDIANHYNNAFHNKQSALTWFNNKNHSTIETFLLEFYCAY
ncbi:hypothetical protein HYE69_07020 [Staphylococcus sp. GSSP0090]|nr:hypothetical protein [Staphylococcus sp. GSSP0090]